jgi:hypothetical protein
MKIEGERDYKREREREREREKLRGGRKNWKHWFTKERFKHPS